MGGAFQAAQQARLKKMQFFPKKALLVLAKS